MRKFFICFLIYFCLARFGLSLRPSSRGTVYKFRRGSSLLGKMSACGPGWNSTLPGPDADTIRRKLEPLPNLYTVPLEDGLEESPKRVRQM
jgi:hypothetical protein